VHQSQNRQAEGNQLLIQCFLSVHLQLLSEHQTHPNRLSQMLPGHYQEEEAMVGLMANDWASYSARHLARRSAKK
jgi:hypothetical protein